MKTVEHYDDTFKKMSKEAAEKEEQLNRERRQSAIV